METATWIYFNLPQMTHLMWQKETSKHTPSWQLWLTFSRFAINSLLHLHWSGSWAHQASNSTGRTEDGRPGLPCVFKASTVSGRGSHILIVCGSQVVTVSNQRGETMGSCWIPTPICPVSAEIRIPLEPTGTPGLFIQRGKNEAMGHWQEGGFQDTGFVGDYITQVFPVLRVVSNTIKAH